MMESQTQKDNFSNIRSAHQTNIHQVMVDTPQNENTIMKPSIETLLSMNSEQSLHPRENIDSSDRVQEQIESAPNKMLDKDNHFKFNCSDNMASILVCRDQTKSRVMSQMLRLKGFEPLKNLDLSSTLLETRVILALSLNGSIHSLKVLNLSQNPIGNSGIKLITDNSNWKDLHTLVLCDIQIDDIGAKCLADNESWTNLEELDLNQNLLIGDIGAMNISYNKAWTHIKRLLLWDCNIGAIGIKYLQRNRIFKFCLETNCLIDKEGKVIDYRTEITTKTKKNSRRKSEEDSLAPVTQFLEPHKRSNLQASESLDNKNCQNITSILRGGYPENSQDNLNLRNMLNKLEEYREKTLRAEKEEDEFNLYINPLARSQDYNLLKLKTNKNYALEEQEEDQSENDI